MGIDAGCFGMEQYLLFGDKKHKRQKAEKRENKEKEKTGNGKEQRRKERGGNRQSNGK